MGRKVRVTREIVQEWDIEVYKGMNDDQILEYEVTLEFDDLTFVAKDNGIITKTEVEFVD